MATTKQIKTKIILRNDSTVNWRAAESTVLLKGEIGIEFMNDGTAKIKIGDGVKTWAQLRHFADLQLDSKVFKYNAAGELDLVGFTEAVAGAQLTKSEDGTLTWVKPDLTTVEGLQTSVAQLQTDVAQKVASVTAKDGTIAIGGSATAPTVGVEVSAESGNIIAKKADGLYVAAPAQVDYTVTVTESTPEGYAKAYTIAQASTGLNTTINIPRDMVVSSGSVVTNPEGKDPGTYLELTLANATSDKIHINVGDLIEYVTSGSQTGDQIMVAVSADHKVTATLSNGSVTLAQLDTAVQESLTKANSAIQDSDLAPIAKSGNINDLQQTDGDILILDCGASTM